MRRLQATREFPILGGFDLFQLCTMRASLYIRARSVRGRQGLVFCKIEGSDVVYEWSTCSTTKLEIPTVFLKYRRLKSEQQVRPRFSFQFNLLQQQIMHETREVYLFRRFGRSCRYAGLDSSHKGIFEACTCRRDKYM
jgi:hypothetical protein